MADNKVPVTVRLSPAGRAWVEEAAHEYKTDMSLVIRAALAVAKARETELVARIEAIKEMG